MLGVSKIDLFFLDVEGAEYIALRSFDWNIKVHYWIIEMDGSDLDREA